MRLGTFATGDGAIQIGAVEGDDVAVLEAPTMRGWPASAERRAASAGPWRT